MRLAKDSPARARNRKVERTARNQWESAGKRGRFENKRGKCENFRRKHSFGNLYHTVSKKQRSSLDDGAVSDPFTMLFFCDSATKESETAKFSENRAN